MVTDTPDRKPKATSLRIQKHVAVLDDGCRKATEIAAIRKIDTLREDKHFYAVVRIRILKQFSGDSCGDPPVPMPNTAVKAANAESTWGEAPWEDRKPLIFVGV